MFNIKKVKRLENHVQSLTIENEALDNTSKSLKNQRDALMGENETLRTQIKEMRHEYNGALEAKETERQELCDQLGSEQQKVAELQHVIDGLKAKLSRKGCMKKQARNRRGQFTSMKPCTE